ncbi:suppressor of cytokine signaling 1b [Pygocentrus nattereri]|nr:suppressor of cytokine signaling 1b [Pygocentrus nattereri]XP_017572801.1 suppressor of cytokine signaling 1b [Pygocentrus nattereri]
MVQHNEPDHAAAPKGPPKPTEVPPAPPAPPTHFHPFRHAQDRSLITQAIQFLENSGFYWGPMDVDEAHVRLAGMPVGTFLIRDSTQTDVFFTLSYRAEVGPTSVRVLLKNEAFNLDGSKHTFPCLFALLEFYISSPKRSLKRPYRGAAPQTLQELSRRAVVRTFGRESVEGLPVSAGLKEFLNLYPFAI